MWITPIYRDGQPNEVCSTLIDLTDIKLLTVNIVMISGSYNAFVYYSRCCLKQAPRRNLRPYSAICRKTRVNVSNIALFKNTCVSHVAQ